MTMPLSRCPQPKGDFGWPRPEAEAFPRTFVFGQGRPAAGPGLGLKVLAQGLFRPFGARNDNFVFEVCSDLGANAAPVQNAPRFRDDVKGLTI